MNETTELAASAAGQPAHTADETADRQQLVYLHASDLGGYSPAAASADWPTEFRLKVGNEEKVYPVTYLDKDLIEEGEYVHPKNGVPIPASRKDLNDWARKAGEMTAEGIELSINCDHKPGARENLGYIKRVRAVEVPGKDGKPKLRLRLTHQFIGDDAPLLALRNRGSLGLDMNYKDAKGRKWGSAIVHSALTPDPVMTGMGSFVPAMLSRAGDQQEPSQAPVYFLSREEPQPTDHSAAARAGAEASPPLHKEQLMTPELRKRLIAHAEAAEDTADDVLLSRVADELDNQREDIETLSTAKAGLERQVNLSRESSPASLTVLEAERDDALAEAERLRKEASDARLDLSRATARPQPTSRELYFASRAYSTERDKLLRERRAAPEMFDRAEERYLGAKRPTTINLSREREVEADDYKLAEGFGKLIDLCEILGNNKPLPQVGEARISLSRAVPGADENAPDADTLKAWEEQDKAFKERQLQSAGAR